MSTHKTYEAYKVDMVIQSPNGRVRHHSLIMHATSYGDADSRTRRSIRDGYKITIMSIGLNH